MLRLHRWIGEQLLGGNQLSGRDVAAGLLGTAGRAADLLRRGAVRAATVLRDAGVPLRPPAYVVYHEEYLSSFQEAPGRFTFDGRRALRIVEHLRQSGVLSRRQILRPQRVAEADLGLIHPRAFLEDIQQPRRLAQLLSVPVNRIRQRHDPLAPFLYQAGGTVLALERAIRTDVPVFNLGGGFHHAQRDRAEGFCPVNDIAIAIASVRRDGLAQRILVIDLDYHHGNGTALIFAEDEQVFTLSIHGQHWARIDGKSNQIDVQLPVGTRDEAYLATVREAVGRALVQFRPDAAIYVAGADPFEQDQLGDFRISEAGMLERDLFVWHTLREREVPFAVVLAGGYGPFAWTIPYNFIHSALSGEPIGSDSRPGNVEVQYRRIKERMGPAELRRGDTESSQREIEQLLESHQASPLFMGTYTLDGMQLALEAYGFRELLRERGFTAPLLWMDTADPHRQVLRVHDQQRDPQHLLIEIVLRCRSLRRPPDVPTAPDGLRMLSIEWLRMQDRRADFTLERPQLPGQFHPGLGLARWMLEALRMMAERLVCAGLMNTPDHYHNACLYAREMRFFDPTVEGRFQALRALLRDLPLVDAAHAVDQGRVHDAHAGRPLRWEGAAQVLALDPQLQRYFASDVYQKRVVRTRAGVQLRLSEAAG